MLFRSHILTDNDFVRRRESPLAFSYKLFLGKHVPDIVVTSGETSKTSNQPDKADVIAVLKETCKELEARKHALEKLLSLLCSERLAKSWRLGSSPWKS